MSTINYENVEFCYRIAKKKANELSKYFKIEYDFLFNCVKEKVERDKLEISEGEISIGVMNAFVWWNNLTFGVPNIFKEIRLLLILTLFFLIIYFVFEKVLGLHLIYNILKWVILFYLFIIIPKVTQIFACLGDVILTFFTILSLFFTFRWYFLPAKIVALLIELCMLILDISVLWLILGVF